MLNIAIMGFGVVGGGVYDVIEMNNDIISKRVGEKVAVKKILDLRTFEGKPFAHLVTNDINSIIDDPEISIVVESMGGSHPAYDFSLKAIRAGKSVITSNKEVVAKFGRELLNEANAHGVKYLYEASVGGGIPLLHPIRECLSVNKIEKIVGILNGTTNFILSQMKNGTKSFDEALREAQRLGYAEQNPSADVDGIDTARKLCILSSLCYGKEFPVADIKTIGITAITSRDMTDAASYDSQIKLLGYSVRTAEGAQCIVCPFLVNNNSYLSKVNDAYNCVCVTGNAVGETAFYGYGAGKLPTASAIVSDITEAALSKSSNIVWSAPDENAPKAEFDRVGKMYIRFSSDDENSVKEAFAFGYEKLSSSDGKLAVITETVSEKVINEALAKLAAKGISAESMIRVL